MTLVEGWAEDIEKNDLIQCQLFTTSHPQTGKRKGADCKYQQNIARMLAGKVEGFLCAVYCQRLQLCPS